MNGGEQRVGRMKLVRMDGSGEGESGKWLGGSKGSEGLSR